MCLPTRLFTALLLVMALAACKGDLASSSFPFSAPGEVREYPPQPIELAGPLASRDAEISGLAWFGDWLILLPQYPDFAGEESFLYALPKAEIETAVDGRTAVPLAPRPIPFVAGELPERIDGYEGFEAIAFAGNDVYLTIEAETAAGMRGYLVKGAIASDLSQIVIDTSELAEIMPQSDEQGLAEEALLAADGDLFTMYEANGSEFSAAPVAHRFSPDLAPLEPMPLQTIEYRVKDATAVDENGRFWVINYTSGGKKFETDSDGVVEKHGQGKTHKENDHVERLVELQMTASGIELSTAPPIQLVLLDGQERKWEGLARLDGRGYLLATDKTPETILAFVSTGFESR